MGDLKKRLRGVFPGCQYNHAVIETQKLKKEAAERIEKLEKALNECRELVDSVLVGDSQEPVLCQLGYTIDKALGETK